MTLIPIGQPWMRLNGGDDVMPYAVVLLPLYMDPSAHLFVR